MRCAFCDFPIGKADTCPYCGTVAMTYEDEEDDEEDGDYS